MKKLLLTLLTIGLVFGVSQSISASEETAEFKPTGFGHYHG
ncbi:hypothetical protein [Anaerobacillus alkaliphilus]|nr:hypothetical protein [Anaerobacillus alkaliphilus]